MKIDESQIQKSYDFDADIVFCEYYNTLIWG